MLATINEEGRDNGVVMNKFYIRGKLGLKPGQSMEALQIKERLNNKQ